jgi:Triose-phosphate Transporter family
MAFSHVDFRYPYFLSAVHMACNAIGSQLVFWSLERHQQKHLQHNDSNDESNGNGSGSNGGSSSSSNWVTALMGPIVRQKLDDKGKRLILAFSVIFSLNIAIGNVSLKYVSVNFNQVMRSLVPAITIAMGLALGKKISMRLQLAVVPIIVGVAMACFGDMSYTALGFFYTMLCIILAALKVVASGEMLTGSAKLHPVDLLGHMAPLALIQCIIISFITGEIQSIASRWSTELSPSVDIYPMAVVWFSGILSFSLNICSLQANKLTSPLTLCIAANVKQVLMIAMSTLLFHIEITPLNGAGIFIVLCGSARYSYVADVEQSQAAKEASVKEREMQSLVNHDEESKTTGFVGGDMDDSSDRSIDSVDEGSSLVKRLRKDVRTP